MNRKEVKSFLPILQAFADGKEIECHEEDKWYKVLEICNKTNPQDYRIKPEPKYRPFKMPMSVGLRCGFISRLGG